MNTRVYPSQTNPDQSSSREVIKKARIALRISKTEMAIALGVSREKLYNYEEGRTPLRAEVLLRFRAFFEAQKAAAEVAINELEKRGVR